MDWRQQEQQDELEWRAVEALKHCARGKPTDEDLALLAHLAGIQWHPKAMPNTEKKQ